MKARRLNLPIAWLLTLLLSVGIAVASYAFGKAGDCKPGQVDGQCGLSTFVGLLYGVVAGLTIFLSLSVYFLIVSYRRRRAARQST